MVVGSLLDVGAGEEGLKKALASLGLEGYEIRIGRKSVGAFDGCDFDVIVDHAHENHDHDMAWLFGDVDGEDAHAHHRDHDHAAPDHHHAHQHDGDAHDDHVHEHHDHTHGHHHHEHRNLADIRTIIGRSSLSAEAKEKAMSVFEVVAEAEAKAHGATKETVHFHEVGAVDSIVDVVAVAWCLDDLGVDDVVVSPLAEGEGHIRCAHGVLPIPVPAVAHIVEAYGLVLRRLHRKGEFVTPTGVAIAAALSTRDSLPEQYRLLSSGWGTGKRDYKPRSAVRALLMEEIAEDGTASACAKESEGSIWKLETEVDDCTGEALGYVLDRLFELGAREAHFVPVYMKNNRPAYQIEVLCDEEKIPVMEEALFQETTTIGIRRYPMQRTVLARERGEMQTPYGTLVTKRVTLPSGGMREYPEHKSVVELARQAGVSYQDVLRARSID
ncbi:MAG: LarC family nickel insertion protein [Atopobiaceae bacterium]|nr:LarC family nickel insertion protein [Atopobiaceae bacterium]